VAEELKGKLGIEPTALLDDCLNVIFAENHQSRIGARLPCIVAIEVVARCSSAKR
jgi:hypothetical protein